MKRWLAGVLLVALATKAAAFERFTWPNGLTLLVEEDASAPVAVLEIWVRAGGRDEPPGKTGLAHMLEHMMFEGGKGLAPGEFARRIEAFGGRDNAFTSHDYTAYFEILPSDHLAEALRLEFARFSALSFPRKVFARENKVVLEERRMRLEDDPNNRLFEELSAAALKLHPYRNPVIGWMQDIRRLTPEDVLAFYRAHYVPENLVIVAVGDVQPEKVKQLVDQTFGRLPARKAPARFVPTEPEPLGPKRITVRLPAKGRVVAVGIPVPSWRPGKNDREAAALAIATDLLASGRSAWLARALVDEKALAFSVDAGYDPFSLGGDLWYAYGMLTPGTTPKAWLQAFWAEVQRLAKGEITNEELARVKLAARADEVFAQDSLYVRAMRLGRLETLGFGAEAADRWLGLLAKVQKDDVARAVRRWLVPDRATVAVLEPVKEKAR